MDATPFYWPDVAEDNPVEFLRRRKILGERMLVAQVTLEKGCKVASHFHDSEQIAIMLSGHVRWGLGKEGTPEHRYHEMKGPGVMVLPSNVPHSVDVLEDSLIIDVLSPPSAMGIDSQKRAH